MCNAAAEAEQRQLIYRRVAELHIECISQGFLTTLGPRFLALMYQAIDESTDSVLLVSRDGYDVVAFVAGTSRGMGPIYRGLLRHWPALLVALLPSLVSPGRLWRILDVVRYSGRVARSTDLPMAELLSIGVDREARGKGHAAGLYQGLCAYFREKQVKAFKIVVGVSLDSAHRFYWRMGAHPASQLEVHRGELSTAFLHTLR